MCPNSCHMQAQDEMLSGNSLNQADQLRLKLSLRDLGRCVIAMRGRITMWIHVWIVHMAEFARVYGGLQRFDCTGLTTRLFASISACKLP